MQRFEESRQRSPRRFGSSRSLASRSLASRPSRRGGPRWRTAACLTALLLLAGRDPVAAHDESPQGGAAATAEDAAASRAAEEESPSTGENAERSVDADSADADSAKSAGENDPATAEPAEAEPAKAEPAKAEPATAEPATAEPADASAGDEAKAPAEGTSAEGGEDEELAREIEVESADEAAPPDAEAPADGEPPTPAPAEGGEGEQAAPTKVGKKRIIGATASVMEKTSGFIFSARVDTGAKSCSLHVEKVIIENESQVMEENYGKLARILVTNGKGGEHWITSRIESHVLVKTSMEKERRYKVPLTLRWKDCEKTVLVTLNDRAHMEFPLLLGRNFLAGDFVVDVEQESSD